MSDCRLHYYVLICNRKRKHKFIEFLSKHDAHRIDVIYGKGSAKSGLLSCAFGFETEEQKAVISCLLTKEKAEEVTRALCDEHEFHKANTGFAFSVPVEKLTF